MGFFILFIEVLILSFLLLIFFIIYKKFQLKSYFETKGIPYNRSDISNVIAFFQGKLSIIDLDLINYKNSVVQSSPIAGYAESVVKPAILVTDPDLARHIFVKDFDHFINRRSFTLPNGDLLFRKMFVTMENDEWKGLRAKISPTFTTGKIRKVFQIFERSSQRLSSYINGLSTPTRKEFDMNELFSKLSMDVIASCAFGINSKTFDAGLGNQSEFEEMANRFQFKFNAKLFLKFMLIMGAPKVASLLGIQATDPVPQNYFLKVIKKVMEHRMSSGERQDDFLQMIMDVQKGLLKEENDKETLEVMTGSKDDQSNSNLFKSGANLKLEDDDIAANCALFLSAGFDTQHSLLIWASYCLAKYPDVQDKVRREVNAKEKLDYDSIHEMTYLDMFVNETLRMFPPAIRTERICNKDYKIPGTSMTIDKGTLIVMPILGQHRDQKYFKDPEMFDVERFSSERKGEIHPYAFRPFGHGPRNCIGMRFALTEAKLVIAKLVKEFKLEVCGRTEVEPKYSGSVTLKPKDALWLKLTKIN